jgi:Cu-processing system ATP-binding protein
VEIRNVISYRGFTKSFGGRCAVDALTLDVARGEVVALLGPNGSGKTTTLKAAAGLIRPTSGEVLVGDPLAPVCEPAARQSLSYLPQRVSFPETLTGREVVEFYRRLRGAPHGVTRDVLQLAALNGASDRAIGTYSGGMTQRLGLAVAMVPAAPILLLDEPTAALDPDGLKAFSALVSARRAAGGTVLFSSHQVGEAERLANRFVILIAGRLAASLTRAELHNLAIPISAPSLDAGRLDALYHSLVAGATR